MTPPPKSKSEMKRLAVQSPLGPLEFKAEDFLDKDNPVRDALPECFRRFAENMALFCAEQANALLAERLDKAPIVVGLQVTTGGMAFFTMDESASATHRARLVLIEKLEVR